MRAILVLTVSALLIATVAGIFGWGDDTPAPLRVPAYNPGGDLDCSDIGHPVSIAGYDPHGLDADNDGIGCESW